MKTDEPPRHQVHLLSEWILLMQSSACITAIYFKITCNALRTVMVGRLCFLKNWIYKFFGIVVTKSLESLCAETLT